MDIVLQLDQDHPQRWWLIVDQERWRQLHTTIWGRRLHLTWKADSLQELEELFFQQEYERAKGYALHRLAAQSYLTTDLQRLLRDRWVVDRTRVAVMAELHRLGLLDDGSWVRTFIRRKLAAKDGPNKIRNELRGRGISDAMIVEAMEELVAAKKTAHEETIQGLLRGRYRHRDLSQFKERQKVIASLLRKGFELHSVLEAVGGVTFD